MPEAGHLFLRHIIFGAEDLSVYWLIYRVALNTGKPIGPFLVVFNPNCDYYEVTAVRMRR